MVGSTRSGSFSAASETNATPPVKSSRSIWATSRARRVLPTPPGPVRVSKRTSGRRKISMAAPTSRSRPISDVSGEGGAGRSGWCVEGGARWDRVTNSGGSGDISLSIVVVRSTVRPHRHLTDFCTIIAIRTCPCHAGRLGIGIGRTLVWVTTSGTVEFSELQDRRLRRERRDDARVEGGTDGGDQPVPDHRIRLVIAERCAPFVGQSPSRLAQDDVRRGKIPLAADVTVRGRRTDAEMGLIGGWNTVQREEGAGMERAWCGGRDHVRAVRYPA